MHATGHGQLETVFCDMTRRADRDKDTEAIWSAGFTHRPYSPVIGDSKHSGRRSRRINTERRTTDVDRVIHSLLRRRRGRIFCSDLHVVIAHGCGCSGDQARSGQTQAWRQSRTRGGRPAPGIRRHTSGSGERETVCSGVICGLDGSTGRRSRRDHQGLNLHPGRATTAGTEEAKNSGRDREQQRAFHIPSRRTQSL